MDQSEVGKNVVRYVRLRDTQFDVYVRYAKRFGIPVKSLFVLNTLYYTPQGCNQMEICLKAYSSKQTVSAIIKGYVEQGYVELTELPTDRRNKFVRLTKVGRRYAAAIVPPLTKAETAAMARLTPEQQTMLVELTTVFGDHLQELLKED